VKVVDKAGKKKLKQSGKGSIRRESSRPTCTISPDAASKGSEGREGSPLGGQEGRGCISRSWSVSRKKKGAGPPDVNRVIEWSRGGKSTLTRVLRNSLLRSDWPKLSSLRKEGSTTKGKCSSRCLGEEKKVSDIIDAKYSSPNSSLGGGKGVGLASQGDGGAGLV